ncbi:OmpA family protein [Photobacterium japonica]|uniref:OmpA family protein n=1 Tax=Photobacterium japonica TaxID=2910235 RepID=UPI003D0BE056
MKVVWVFLFSLFVVGCASTSEEVVTKTKTVSKEKVDAFLSQSLRDVQAVVGRDVGSVARKGDQVLITLKGDQSFNHDSATVRAEGEDVLRKLSGILVNEKDSRIFVGGHTDSVGSDEYNRVLSTKRATSVSDLLTTYGVDSKRVGVFGFGESAPIGDNKKASGRQDNRRIEIRLTPIFDNFLE